MTCSQNIRRLKHGCFTFLVETFPAELADERFVAGVDPDVSVERRASVERFPALVAFMRLFLNGKKREKRTEGSNQMKPKTGSL